MDGRGRICPNGGAGAGAPASGGPFVWEQHRGIAPSMAKGVSDSFGALHHSPLWLVVSIGLVAAKEAAGGVVTFEEERGEVRIAQVPAGVQRGCIRACWQSKGHGDWSRGRAVQ